MANDLATLNGYLDTALKDTGDTVWGASEKNNLIDWAVASLWPRYSRPLDPTATTITFQADTYYYSLPGNVRSVSRIDLLDSDGNEYGPAHGRAWEVVGDLLSDGEMYTGKLHIAPQYVSALGGGTARIHGYGVYDTTSYYIPDIYVSLVLAKARAEAYRRLAASREQFKVWLARNQSQNVSVNELLQMINEADSEVRRLELTIPRVWQKPVPGRQG